MADLVDLFILFLYGFIVGIAIGKIYYYFKKR